MNLDQAVITIIDKVRNEDLPSKVTVSPRHDGIGYIGRSIFYDDVRVAGIFNQKGRVSVEYFNDFDEPVVNNLIIKLGKQIEARFMKQRQQLADLVGAMK